VRVRRIFSCRGRRRGALGRERGRDIVAARWLAGSTVDIGQPRSPRRFWVGARRVDGGPGRIFWGRANGFRGPLPLACGPGGFEQMDPEIRGAWRWMGCRQALTKHWFLKPNGRKLSNLRFKSTPKKAQKRILHGTGQRPGGRRSIPGVAKAAPAPFGFRKSRAGPSGAVNRQPVCSKKWGGPRRLVDPRGASTVFVR